MDDMKDLYEDLKWAIDALVDEDVSKEEILAMAQKAYYQSVKETQEYDDLPDEELERQIRESIDKVMGIRS